MNQAQVADILKKRVPYRDSWVEEPHGEFFIKSHDEVTKVLYCVTPTDKVVQQFKDEKYDMLVSHHPYIVKVPQVILHTAMDCCQGGLNDQWRDAVGIKEAKHFDRNLGWYGKIDPINPDDFYMKVRDFIGAAPIGAVYCDKEHIESVVVCSGLGGMVHREALASGADCYILGQATSNPMDSDFPAMIEVGHTLSEYSTGLKIVKNTLEPHGIIVHGADLKYDKFGSEIHRNGFSNAEFDSYN